jgi:uncharacterized NAD(P)/FAD-binding protein YdhS
MISSTRSSGGDPRIVVVGGGAAGTITAVHLMRAARGGLEVVLLDRDGKFGPGLAYGTDDPLHLLNVPAGRMGALAGQPDHFQAWLGARGAPIAGTEFLPRGVYGLYLTELLDQAAAAAGAAVRLRRRGGEVVSLAQPSELEGKLELSLAGGERVQADAVVLAIGNLPGRDPVPVSEELVTSGLFVRDPWAPGALDAARTDRSVLVIGTGLTMVDVALSLARKGSGPIVRAVSRHGVVPRRHRRDPTRIEPFPVPGDAGSLEPVVTALIEQIGRAGERGRDWRDVLDSMRPATPELWRSLRGTEKQRFMSNLQRLWDVHRFRMPPDVADRFDVLRAQGRLSIDSCSVVGLDATRVGVRASLRAVGQDRAEEIEVDRVINCSGPGADVTRRAPRLVASLLAAGIGRPDELRLGLDVDREGRLIESTGMPSSRIHVVGGLRKGVEWEATGITEIREQAANVTRSLDTVAGTVVRSRDQLV